VGKVGRTSAEFLHLPCCTFPPLHPLFLPASFVRPSWPKTLVRCNSVSFSDFISFYFFARIMNEKPVGAWRARESKITLLAKLSPEFALLFLISWA